ncbi:SDR family NAD(P)-dependent oxidoreductase [Actinocorallia sp. API 0066]|uniref:SDR family NAD(P)-dependent oxidoreductase n=1 Tax=Actinocorallia sp. API 0066 TaxID=2896846 RepID=UPI001E2F21EB|nr:SDR family NAD(P)-dependent oxidoreductase [Actinocorallia sp. API 0066]MCD0448230.1 SDR family NAD(P)-dependent oxidoreductase [Actinocorallia sp. API 0066]
MSTWKHPDLADRVAVVTGASRGVGRGVALALAECGATVYVTGRSAGGAATEGLPGTVDGTAEEVTARGGRGVAVRCDQADDADVADLFERVREETGGLDLLVNNAWSGYERSHDVPFDAPFWKQPMWRYDLFAGSLRGWYLAARLAVPLMLERGSGLIINIGYTDGPTYLGQVAYDVVKNATDRMSFAMAHDLRRPGLTALALHPGFVGTERVQAAWEMLGDGPARIVHSPEYVGRAVAHLLAEPDLAARSGAALAVGDLAEEYGFDDVDGRRPPAFRLEGRMSLATRMERLNRVVASATEGTA